MWVPPQIRNKGTIGGNVANASPAADLPPVLWLLNAQVEIMGPGGATRVIPIQELPTGRQTRHDPGPERGAGPLSHRPAPP